MPLRAHMFVSTALLVSAFVALVAPLLLLATPVLGKAEVVDDIAFVVLVGLFPLLAAASLIASAIRFLRTRARQAAIEIGLEVLLLAMAAMSETP